MVYFVCTLIFGLIVNTIVTKIADTEQLELKASSPLMTAATITTPTEEKQILQFSPPNPRNSANDFLIEDSEDT